MPEVVVITGASAGVGRATARRFAAEGAAIGLISRSRERLESAAREVEAAGGRALVLPLDVADDAAVERAAAQVEETFGPIDTWVNDAMATIFAPFGAISAEEFRRATEVTYLGCVWGTMAALRRMRQRDRGTIVQVGSALAYQGIPLQAPYCGAKHAIEGFTQSLRTELMHNGSGVRITIVQLPAHNTPQFSWGRSKMPEHPQPVPPIFQPEVAADAIVHAAHHPRRELLVGWPTVKAVLGSRIAPWFADRYVAKTGYRAQQTPPRTPEERPGNLFVPPDGDPGAHGGFDDRAKPRSLLWWANSHRQLLGLAAGAGTAVVAAAVARLDGNR